MYRPQSYSLLLFLFFANLIFLASAGQTLGCMSIPMDISSYLTGAFLRRDSEPWTAACGVDHGYDSSLAPAPTMFRTAWVSLTNTPRAKSPAVEFKENVEEECIAGNLKRFDCNSYEIAAGNRVSCKMSIMLVEGATTTQSRCVEKAIEKFMGREVECSYEGF